MSVAMVDHVNEATDCVYVTISTEQSGGRENVNKERRIWIKSGQVGRGLKSTVSLSSRTASFLENELPACPCWSRKGT